MNYFIYKNDKPTGPFDKSVLRQMLNKGEIREDSLACPEGENEWKPLGNLLNEGTVADSPTVGGGINLDMEFKLYTTYSEEIDTLIDLLGEVDEKQAKDIHKQIAHKMSICRKHIDSVKPYYPHSIEFKSMEADYLFNSALKKLWEHGFSHRAAQSQLEKGAEKRSLTRLGFAGVSRMMANQKEKNNAAEALQLLEQSLRYLDAPSTRLAKANVHNALGQTTEALGELDFIIMNFQDDPAYIAARRLKDEIETPPKKGMCFIATAAYGNYNAPEVLFLSRFRDESLSRTIPGRAVISLYYFASPPIALFISRSNLLRAVIRKLLLQPMIAILKQLRQK